MKKFEFSLGRMLDYRQSLLEKEKNTLMQLFARRSAMEHSLEVNGQQQQQTGEELRVLTQRGTTIAEIQQIDYRLAAMRRQAEQLQKDLIGIGLAIDRQREVVTEVSQQVKGLELLRENQLEEYNYAARKEEEDRIAELISSKIARQQR